MVRLLDFGVRGLHFYCLNHEKVPLAILDSLGMGAQQPVEESEANETANVAMPSALRGANPSVVLA